MILTVLFTLIFGVLGFFVSLLPGGSPVDLSGIADGLAPVFAGFGWANNYIPVDTALTLVGIVVTSQVAMGVANLVIWILSKLHILGGGSS